MILPRASTHLHTALYVTGNWLLQFRNDTDDKVRNDLINKVLVRIMEHITDGNKTTSARLTDSTCWNITTVQI